MKKIIKDDENHSFVIENMTAKEIKIVMEIWDIRDQYESMDISKLPLVCEYAKIFNMLQECSAKMKGLNDKELEDMIAKYSKLQKSVIDYRKILQLDKMKEKSTNRWATILMKRAK